MKIHCEPVCYGIRRQRIKWETGFYVRTVELQNDSPERAEILSVVFSLYGEDDKKLCAVVYEGISLENRFREAVEELGFYRDGTWGRILGEYATPKEKLALSTVVEPGLSGLIVQEHFQIEAMEAVTSCVILCAYRQNGALAECSVVIEVQEYTGNNVYDFPVRGTWIITDIYKSVDSHRWCRNSEFAFDAGMLREDLQLFPDEQDRQDNAAFRCYGEYVYAPADGVVLETEEHFPEFTSAQKETICPEEWDKLEAQYGPDARINGNYVSILHAGNEVSTVCHLIPGSVTVKPGQRVKQGDRIGRVGTSGNSTCPHLHFHLSEYPGKGKAVCLGRGLPCHFQGVTDIFGEPVAFPDEDGMLVFVDGETAVTRKEKAPQDINKEG